MAVRQRVQPQHLTGRALRVVAHGEAEVRGLLLARPVRRERCTDPEQRDDDRCDPEQRGRAVRPEPSERALAATACEADRDDDATDDEQHGDGADRRARGEQRDEHEPGQERSGDPSERRQCRQAPDDAAGVVERVELQLDDDGRHGGQHGGRREEREGREDHGGRRTGAAQADREHVDDRDRHRRERATGDEQRGEQPSRRGAVRGPPTQPRPERDAGEHDADDRRVRLDRVADVGDEQPGRKQLEDEHGGRRQEHEEGGVRRRHGAGG